MSRQALLGDLAHLIAARRKGITRPLVVGVTGVDTAGKSELAADLLTVLRDNGMPAEAVHVDEFHRPRALRYDLHLPEPEQYYHRSIDFDRLARQVLRPLREHGSLDRTVETLDPLTDRRTWRTYTIPSAAVVVLEGVFLFRPEVRPYVDLLVYLHVDENVVLERARARDVPIQGEAVLGRYASKYLPAQRSYLSAYPPEQLADVLIDNSDWAEPEIRRWPLPRRAVLFDLWKTLVPLPDELKRRTFEMTARALGQRPRDLADVWQRTRKQRETMPFEEYLRRLRTNLGRSWPDDAEAAAAAIRRRLHGKAFTTPLPGAVETAAAVRRLGHRTAVVSNCTSDVRAMIASSPFADMFDEVVLSADIGVLKPDPKIFLIAAARLGIEPSHCLFVGDGTDGELDGAVAAGMNAVLLDIGEPRSWAGPRIGSLPHLLDVPPLGFHSLLPEG